MLQLNNLKTRTATNTKISVFICIEAIIYLLLYKFHVTATRLEPTTT